MHHLNCRWSLPGIGPLFVVLACGVATPVRGEEWRYPVDVAVGADGIVYIADRELPGIWALKDGKSEVLVRGSKVFRAPLNAVRCLDTVADGTIFVGDSATREVYRMAADGALTQLTALQPLLEHTKLTDDLRFTADHVGRIGIPMAMAVNAHGDLFIADTERQRVWKLPAGAREPEEFLVARGPRGVAVDVDDNVWVLSLQAPQLQRVSAAGTPETVVGGPTFEFPHQVAVRNDGTAVVSDGYAQTIWNVTAEGQASPWIAGDPLVNPIGIAFQGEHLLIIDPRAKALYSAAPDGTLTKLYP